jgi:HEPN domain-containing protein/predicted nucleotidyltransferase
MANEWPHNYCGMKTTLDHLPKNKQYEIARIADIILEVVNPEKIILFGSYAKGTYVEHKYQTQDRIIHEYISDYDFLVVTRNNPEKTYAQEATIMDRVDRYDPPVNLEIHEIDYINRGLEFGQYFFTDIVNEGILLYDKGKVSFVKPKQLTVGEEKQIAQSYFEFWLAESQPFLKGSAFFLEQGDLRHGAFNLHQATESLYYAVMLVFTGYKPKLHNLWKLRKKTKQYSIELFTLFKAEADKKEEALFDLLKRAYVEARYNEQNYNITGQELNTLIERIREMVAIVERICKEKIASLKV